METGSKSVLFNAVPLLLVAALYLGVGLALVPSLWRDRRRLTAIDLGLGALFPCIAVPAAVFGFLVLHDREPLGGELWSSFVATLVAFVPPLLLVGRWRERAFVTSGMRAREAEAKTTIRDRELETVSAVSTALARTHDAEAAARLLLQHVVELFGVEFTALALVDQEGQAAVGFLALGEEGELDWWRDVRLDLANEPSGIASAVFEAAPVAIYDVEGSTRVSPRLAEAVGAKSGVWVPLISEERVLGVLVAVTTGARRAFTSEEITLMQALAGDAAMAFERAHSAAALEDALDRERLVSRVATKVRSELDVEALLHVAVAETGAALGVDRCFVRLGEPGEPMPVVAEWRAPGAASIGEHARALPVSNLALRERRTVAVEDLDAARELDDPALGGRHGLRELGVRAVLATPIVAFDEVIGVLGLHRSTAGPWSDADVTVVEAVAREASLALHTTRLLEENARRIDQQAGLLKAAQALGSELQLDAVIQLLVDQVAQLLDVDAADCYLLDPARDTLRCAAVHGLPADLVGYEFPAGKGVTGEALRAKAPVVVSEYEQLPDPVPHEAYAGFSQAMVAPMTWSGATLGVLGVGVRAGTRTFASSDADLLEAFAGLASLALRNAESFAGRTRQARIQLGFYRIAAILGHSLSLAETYHAVAQAASEALGGAFAAVLVPRGSRLEPVGAHEVPEPLLEALQAGVASTDALADAARERRVLAASRLADDDRFGVDFRALAAGCRCRSVLAVPVEPGRGDAGLVLVFFGEERRFEDDDLELARNLAGATHGALERAELFEAERSARALSQQLARTGGLLATELDPAAVLDEVVQQAPRLVGAEACTIRILEEDELVVTAAEGEAAEVALGARSPAIGRLSGDVVQSRAPVAIERADDDPRLVAADPVLAAGCSSYLGVPLVGPEGSLHGVLSVYGERPRAWRPEEVEALLALAGNTSAALSNAELYQRVALEKERSFAILANIADGIVAVDREGRVVLWNQAAEQITGVPQEEALGRAPAQALGRDLESPGDEPVPIVRGGQRVWLSVTEAVMRDPAGVVAGRIYAFRDISADQVVEQMKSDFVSAVSHELRTPLTSIYGFAETLLRQDVLFGEEEQRTFLSYIASESERLTRIVDALLNVARLETDDLQVSLAPTEVGALVSETVAAAQASSPDEHAFVVDVPDAPLAAEADAEKLRQILGVLLDNAVRYSPAGGTVTVSARRKADKVELEVADEGIGIPAAERDRIFRKFYRAEASTRDGGQGGTGLGLFIAQGLVGAMGSRIDVHSVEGEGSSFSFELPLAPAPVPTSVE